MEMETKPISKSDVKILIRQFNQDNNLTVTNIDKGYEVTYKGQTVFKAKEGMGMYLCTYLKGMITK